MRDFTFIKGTRFNIVRLYRSQRFDVDRLDLSWVEEEMPEFVRGLRVVDHDDLSTVTVDGVEADQLAFSLHLIWQQQDDINSYRAAADVYLAKALETKDFLVSNHRKGNDGEPPSTEALLH